MARGRRKTADRPVITRQDVSSGFLRTRDETSLLVMFDGPELSRFPMEARTKAGVFMGMPAMVDPRHKYFFFLAGGDFRQHPLRTL